MINRTFLSAYLLLAATVIYANDHTLLQALYDHNVVKHGAFIFRSGQKSSIYVDMRNAISSPSLLTQLAHSLNALAPAKKYDRVCGVPYGTIPLATALALERNEPMIMLRKEIKNHGTQKRIEGEYKPGDRVLLIEDVITTGGSVREAIDLLEQQGLIVEDVIACLDYQQGSVEKLRDLGYPTQALYTIADIINHTENTKYTHNLTYAQRAQTSCNVVSQKIFAIMEQKKTNLALAADVTTTQELLSLAELLGPHICVLKIHVDILTDFTPLFIEQLKTIAQQHTFLLMADRKFSDIGNTTQLQYTQGIYHIADWADLVTVQALPGAGILASMQQATQCADRAVVLITQMSSHDNLASSAYTNRAIAMGNEHTDFVAGLIARTAITPNEPYFFMTTGIHLSTQAIADQTYLTPYEAIFQNGTDIIIVGRAIYESPDPIATAIAYKNAGWEAYQKRIGT